jgi:exportin-T
MFLPLLLRFFSDEFDDVSSAVFPVTFDLLALLRKEKKVTGTLSSVHAAMLPPILNAVVIKTKYDPDSNWGDEDAESEEAEFQNLRKKLKTMQDAISIIDENLYINLLSQLVESTFDRLGQPSTSCTVDWRDLDLALYEMASFGEMAVRSGGLFVKGQPNGPAAQKLITMLAKMLASSKYIPTPLGSTCTDIFGQMLLAILILWLNSSRWKFSCDLLHFLKCT